MLQEEGISVPRREGRGCECRPVPVWCVLVRLEGVQLKFKMSFPL